MTNKKLLVTGGSAAGKTTLAKALGVHLGLPVSHLDSIAYLDERWTPRASDEIAAAINAIIQRPEWLVEGGQLGWTRPLYDQASAIIWLDTPFGVTLWRRWKLFRGRSLRFQFQQVLWQLRSYYGAPGPDDNPYASRAALHRVLRQHRAKVLRYRRAPTVHNVILDLERLNGRTNQESARI